MTTRTALEVILEALAPVSGRKVLDIGCGTGALCAPLTEAGAIWQGLDPAGGVGGIPVDAAPAQAMPYGDSSFDHAVCVNALHHVPVSAMAAALSEAGRVLCRTGRLLVIEPRAEGALSRVIAVVDDETEIRTAAQAAMDRTTALVEVRAFDYARVERYADFDAFCATLVAAAPERAELIGRRRAAMQAAFEGLASRDGDLRTLSQPMSARLFRPA